MKKIALTSLLLSLLVVGGVALAGGRLQVETAPGSGTTLVAEVPLR